MTEPGSTLPPVILCPPPPPEDDRLVYVEAPTHDGGWRVAGVFRPEKARAYVRTMTVITGAEYRIRPDRR